jgi:hypothetical protein
MKSTGRSFSGRQPEEPAERAMARPWGVKTMESLTIRTGKDHYATIEAGDIQQFSPDSGQTWSDLATIQTRHDAAKFAVRVQQWTGCKERYRVVRRRGQETESVVYAG